MENELSTDVANSGSLIASESLLDRKTSYRAPGVCRMALVMMRWLVNHFTLWHVAWRLVNAERVVFFCVHRILPTLYLTMEVSRFTCSAIQPCDERPGHLLGTTKCN